MTHIALFEWDQDYENGPHYHVMKLEWKGKHLNNDHRKAGEAVPEPWNSIFFGG